MSFFKHFDDIYSCLFKSPQRIVVLWPLLEEFRDWTIDFDGLVQHFKSFLYLARHTISESLDKIILRNFLFWWSDGLVNSLACVFILIKKNQTFIEKEQRVSWRKISIFFKLKFNFIKDKATLQLSCHVFLVFLNDVDAKEKNWLNFGCNNHRSLSELFLSNFEFPILMFDDPLAN